MTKTHIWSAVFALAVAPSAIAEDDSRFEEQDFLFLNEEAYTQESGEWQAGAGWEHAFDGGYDMFEFEFEYGFTDRFQLAAELPLINEGGGARLGDIEIAADYAFLKESEGDFAELTIGVAATAPTGESDAGAHEWGYELSLRSSKHILPGLYSHLSGAYEWLPDGGTGADFAHEWTFGAGAAWRAGEKVTLIGEYRFEKEKERILSEREIEKEAFLSVGIAVEWSEGLIVGAAAAAGLMEDAENRMIAKIQAEW